MPNEQQQNQVEGIRQKLAAKKMMGSPDKPDPGSDVPNKVPCDGPCRELAQSMLKRLIERHERRAASLRALLALLPEEGTSPAEEALWRIFTEGRPGSDW